MIIWKFIIENWYQKKIVEKKKKLKINNDNNNNNIIQQNNLRNEEYEEYEDIYYKETIELDKNSKKKSLPKIIVEKVQINCTRLHILISSFDCKIFSPNNNNILVSAIQKACAFKYQIPRTILSGMPYDYKKKKRNEEIYENNGFKAKYEEFNYPNFYKLILLKNDKEKKLFLKNEYSITPRDIAMVCNNPKNSSKINSVSNYQLNSILEINEPIDTFCYKLFLFKKWYRS